MGGDKFLDTVKPLQYSRPCAPTRLQGVLPAVYVILPIALLLLS